MKESQKTYSLNKVKGLKYYNCDCICDSHISKNKSMKERASELEKRVLKTIQDRNK